MTHWPTSLPELSDHQREQIIPALASSRMALLTGGPGSGKTYCAASIISKLVEEFGAHTIAACAPTGKAAVRLSEGFEKYGLNIKATTIHRLLGVSRNGHDGKGWGFVHNRRNRLTQRFFILDESSMVGCPLGAAFFSAIPPRAHVLAIGDPHQLPPVEHGAFLRDAIRAGSVPHAHLTEIQRNSGRIVKACKELRETGIYRPGSIVDEAAGENLVHFETRDSTRTLGAVNRLLANCPDGIDPCWDVQFMVAVKDKSDLGTKRLNLHLQKILNPAAAASDARLCFGDKVICRSNGIYPMLSCPSCFEELDFDADKHANGERPYICDVCAMGWKYSNIASEFVANGEIGVVCSAVDGEVHVKFDSPTRVAVMRGKNADVMDLAYAITVHKSQGSQFPIAVYLSDDYGGARRVSCRELIYTAISRAENLAITIGSKSTIQKDCGRIALDGRKTFLAELIRSAAA